MNNKPVSLVLKLKLIFAKLLFKCKLRNQIDRTNPNGCHRFDLHWKLETPTLANKALLNRINKKIKWIYKVLHRTWHEFVTSDIREPAGRGQQYWDPDAYSPEVLIFQVLLCKSRTPAAGLNPCYLRKTICFLNETLNNSTQLQEATGFTTVVPSPPVSWQRNELSRGGIGRSFYPWDPVPIEEIV